MAAWGLAGAAAAENLVVARGYVSAAAVQENVLWFRFDRDPKRFEVDLRRAPDAGALVAAVKGAGEQRRLLEVRFDPQGGTFRRMAADVPTYRVRELAYGALRAAGEPPLPEGKRGTGPAGDLSLAIALAPSGRFEIAKAAYDRALAGKLSPQLQALAHRERGALLRDRAYLVAAEPTKESDELLVAALADFRAWRNLVPTDQDAMQAEAGALTELGAYDEALALYRQVDDVYWSQIRIGAIHRLRGEYQQALAALDEITRRLGPQPGMAWRYHRGWTLAEMGRNSEAVDEFAIGLRNQPDYAWALLRRACSLARLGRFREAVADQTRGIELREASLKDIEGTPATRHDDDQAQKVLVALTAAAASDRAQAFDVGCDDYWGAAVRRRTRSPLLPPG